MVSRLVVSRRLNTARVFWGRGLLLLLLLLLLFADEQQLPMNDDFTGWWSCSVNPVANPFFNGDDDDDDDVSRRLKRLWTNLFSPSSRVMYISCKSLFGRLRVVFFRDKKVAASGCTWCATQKSADDTEVCAQSMHKMRAHNVRGKK